LLFFPAEDGIRDRNVTGVQTCALPISTTCVPAAVAPVPTGTTTWSRSTHGRSVSVGHVGAHASPAAERAVVRLSPSIARKVGSEIGRASCRERVEEPVVADARRG